MKTLISTTLVFSMLLVGCGDEETGTPDSPTAAEIKSKLKAATVKIKATGTFTETDGTVQGSWSGSGFFVGDSGYIVTNNHVAAGAGVLTIEGDGFSGSASPVAFAECADLAVLQLTSSNTGTYSSLEWFQGTPEVGMNIAVSGYAGNLQTGTEGSYTYFEGQINRGVEESNTSWSSVDAFVHSAAASSGNSGGPVVELTNGKIVGIHYAGFVNDNNRKFAISSDVANRYIEQMMGGEDVLSIGISGSVVYNGGNARGVWVKAVRSGSKAKAVGIKPGDLITSIEGVSLSGSSADVTTMKRYCSILESNMGNNPDNIFSIEVFRTSSNSACVGEINGTPLARKDNDAQSCSGQVIDVPDEPEEGEQVSGSLGANDDTLNDGSYFDEYLTTATRSGTATVRMNSSSFETYILVYTAERTLLLQGRGEVTFTVTNGESYIILANSENTNSTGPYTLNLGNVLTQSSGSRSNTVSGSLGANDDTLNDGSYFDEYLTTATRSGIATVRMNSSSFETYILVYTAERALLQQGRGEVTFTVTNGESYIVLANSENTNSTGPYTLDLGNSLTQSSGSRSASAQNTTISGTLNSNDSETESGRYVDVYNLSVDQSGPAKITMKSSFFRSMIFVFDADNEIVARGDASAIGGIASVSFNVVSGKTYNLYTSSEKPNQTGSYSLVLTGGFSDVAEIN